MHVPQRLMLRGLGIFAVLVAVGAALSFLPPRARASRSTAPWTGTAGVITGLRTSLDAQAGELELRDIELKRAIHKRQRTLDVFEKVGVRMSRPTEGHGVLKPNVGSPLYEPRDFRLVKA